MSFDSILRDTPYHLKLSEVEYPSFFKDLNLDQIVERMLVGWEDYPLNKYFYYPAKSIDTVTYRREIYRELKTSKLRNLVLDFSRTMKQARKFMDYREQLERLMKYQDTGRSSLSVLSSYTVSEIKHRHFLYDGAKRYIQAVMQLWQGLEEISPVSAGMQSLREYLREYCNGEAFEKLQQDVEELTEQMQSLRFQMVLSGNKLTLNDDYDTFEARDEIMRRCGFSENTAPERGREPLPKEMRSPFPNILEIKEFEGLLLSMLHSSRRDVFRRLEQFEELHEELFAPELLQFEEEVQVYLAAGKFFEEMDRYGFAFTDARISQEENREFRLYGNYDAALACKYCYTPEKVVANDCYMDPGERFYVITGPNQGGKTTFARAVGQAVYFNQMGFPVPGTKAVLPAFSVLLTHFPAEEELESGAGKLKEELGRLAPMLRGAWSGGFVILNELFTTATTYDAKLMGTDVIRRFLDMEFSGIYVTHLRELAYCDERIVSLVAQVEDSDSKARTYRIKRAEAKGLAYAQTIAERYRLSHDEIISRVKNGNREG